MPVPIPPGTLAYGMQLPIQSQSTIYAEPWEASAGADELAFVAKAADRNGFWYVAVCDHVAIPRPLDEKMGTSWWDTIATLGWLAGITEHVHLMSHVYVLPYRHPLMAAKAFLTLDEVSGGRAVLGVGAGHVQAEFELLGVDFDRRGALLDDAIDVVRAAFTEEYPDVDTPSVRVAGAGLRPRGRQAGGPPIWVGGSSRAALRRAADKGDGWLPQGPPPDGVKAAIAYLHERREQNGRADLPFVVGGYGEVLYVGDPWFEPGPGQLAGPPEVIAERLRKSRAIGIDQVQLRFHTRSCAELCDQLDAFGSGVAPLLAD
ncbi:MAG TPA: TIGR03619 family F420-dependent LLM class oxidoreductase [Acidimicrobiales bacterium]|nr:TIGR03619 family F420-dependent LLM class oxidoreductase [Acidimicrobiales bacterium]